jgi:hypothetical protein
MFEYPLLRWKIWRFERAARADEEGTGKAVEAAKARGASDDEIEEIAGGSDESVLRRKVHEAMSKYLVSKAHRMVIPLPDSQDEKFWSINSDNNERVLTRAGINELRSAIRGEKKARVELFLMWVPGVVGILGTLIGLASILKR